MRVAAAGRVAVEHGRSVGRHVAVAPVAKREEDRVQRVAFLGKAVLVAGSSGPLIRGATEDALLDQAGEPIGQAAA